jgi:two-component system copper resistance phosphate regulon response regulator CusR
VVRVLLIEDEKGLSDGISAALRVTGFAVDAAGDIRTARALATRHRYDCVICDRMLPDGDGIQILGDGWRLEQQTPVLMLTARDALRDRVDGIERGADDYLGKPFAMSELLARVKMLCRRRDSIAPPVVRIGSLEIDANRREVSRDGVVLSLTAKEFSVIELLSTRPGQVVSREEITEQCWDRLTEPMSNAVDVVISQLRRKLGEPSPIGTVRGAGWVLEEGS